MIRLTCIERRLLVAAVAMLAFTACGRADEPASGVPLPTVKSSADREEPGLLGSWRFESLEVDGVPFAIDRQMFLDITVDGFRAETTCNAVSGTVGGEISTTLMVCGTAAATDGERYMSQALRNQPVQIDDQLVFDDGNVRLVYKAFTDPLPGELFAVLADQALDVDESVLPTQEFTGTVPPDFDTLVPLPSPTSEIDLFLAVINSQVCVVYGTDTAYDMWCQQPRFAAGATTAVNIPIYRPPMFRIALIPDRFGPAVTSRPDLGTYSHNLLVVSDDAPTGNHMLTDTTDATFKLTISTGPTTPTATSQPLATANETITSQHEPGQAGTSEPTLATTTEPVQPDPDSLEEALVILGVDIDGGPAAATQLGDANLCGVERLSQAGPPDGGPDETARRCFLDHHISAQPAVFVEALLTIDGDPVVTVWRTLSDGTIEQHTDSTRDLFGSGTWQLSTCDQLTTLFPEELGTMPPFHFGCDTTTSDGGSRLETQSASMPTWFAQRQPLASCGYEISVSDRNLAYRECFADAVRYTEPVEYAYVSTGDEGERSTRWFRSLGDGTFEVVEWQSADAFGSPSRWIHHRCTTIVFADEAGGETDRLPQINVDGECSEVLTP